MTDPRQHNLDLTVVTITKDEPKAALRTLTSVQRQINCRLESIVVDAAAQPTRGLFDLVDQIGGEYHCGSDQGPYAAMNLGLHHAEGRSVVFLNAGDTFTSVHSASILVRLTRAAEWGYGCLRLLDEDGRNPKVIGGPRLFTLFRLGLAFIPHPSTVVRTSTLREIGGFDTTLGSVADQATLMRLSAHYSPATTSEIVAEFARGGLSSTKSPREIAAGFQRCRHYAGLEFGPWPAVDSTLTLFTQLVRSIRQSAQRGSSR